MLNGKQAQATSSSAKEDVVMEGADAHTSEQPQGILMGHPDVRRCVLDTWLHRKVLRRLWAEVHSLCLSSCLCSNA